jgi:hypothetical protein
MSHLPSDGRSHPRGMDTSATPTFKPKKITKCYSFCTFTPDLDKFYANRYNKTSWSFAPVIIMMAIIGQQPRTTQN